jgi:hypothetical protein
MVIELALKEVHNGFKSKSRMKPLNYGKWGNGIMVIELALKEVHNGFKSKSRMKPLNYGK